MNVRKGLFAMAAGAAFAAAPALAGTNSITFDLSNVFVDPIGVSFSLPAGAGTVTSVDWNIDYTVGQQGSISWASEMALELVAPGATANAPIASNFPSAANTGYYPTTPSNAGTYIWGTNYGSSGPNQWAVGFVADTNLNFPDLSTGTHSNAGSTAGLNGVASGGSWALNIYDSYADSPPQGFFQPGSYITVNYVPEPASAALLGLAALAATRRRR